MWKKSTHPKLMAHSNDVLKQYEIFLSFYEFFAQLSEDDVVYHYINNFNVDYIDKDCLRNSAF